MADDEFRGVFRLKYAGDAHLVLQTKVQANPLLNRPTSDLPFAPVQMVAADAPLTVPMFLQLSDMELDGVVILQFTKGKGLSMVFRNDPLNHVLVTSTFDSIAAIRDFLQTQIEKKLRQLVCDELPSIIHTLSHAWAGARKSPKVQATHLDFSVPALEAHQVSGLTTPRTINLCRNQSFTGRGQLTPFTPAIAQAIYKSTSLSALDLAERKSKSSTSPRISPKKEARKKHSVIKLNIIKETVPEKEAIATSYFDKSAPISPHIRKTRHISLAGIDEKAERPRSPKLTDAQRVKRLEALMSEKTMRDRVVSTSVLEDDVSHLVL